MAIPDPSAAEAEDAAAPARPRERSHVRAALVSFEQRDFRYLGLSTLVLGLGQWAQQIAIAWLALELTGSPIQLGAISAFRGGVGVFASPLGGYLADRFPRRMVTVWTTIASAVQASIFALLLLSGHIQLWEVYVLAFAGGVIQSLAQPARQSLVYDVTTNETLFNAVALNSVMQNFARISGPPLSGAIIGFWGTGTLFVALAGTQLVAVALTLMISAQTRQQQLTGGRGAAAALGDVMDGFRYTWSNKLVLGLMIGQAIPILLVAPYIPFVAVFAKDVLHRGPEAYGQLASMVGWGSILGLAVLTLMGDPKRKGMMMIGAFMCYLMLLLVFTRSQDFTLSLAALACAGIFSSVGFALNTTLIQLAADNAYRGRVNAVWHLVSGLQPLGALPMGLLIERRGAPFGVGSFVVAAIIALALFGLTFRSVRRA